MTPDFPQFLRTLAPMGSRVAKKALQPLRQATLSQIELLLGAMLPSGCLDKNPSGAHSRNRLLPLNRAFWSWLWQILQANTSCREVMKQLVMLLGLSGRSIAQNSSPYCQSRSLIPLSLLQKIYAFIGDRAFAGLSASTFLQGRRLKAADGTSVRLADTPENQRAFPQPASQNPGAGFPVMKIAAFFCVASGALLAHATGHLSNSEISLVVQLLGTLRVGDILVTDRGFCNYALAALLIGKNVDIIARVPTGVRRIDFRKAVKRLGSKDGLFVWKKPRRPSKWLSSDQWRQIPETLTLRLIQIHIRLPGVRAQKITLMTTLLDPILYPSKEIAEAYRLRWREEMCFDDLKTTLNMAHLKCLSPEMVRKELCMFLVAHNALRCLIVKAAVEAQIQVEQISFKGTMDGFRQCAIAMTQVKTKTKRTFLWNKFVRGLAEDALPDRRGRVEPRAVKRIIKYPKLTGHRRRYKDRLSRNQRRRLATKRRQQSQNLN
jgi:hypothetical protein